MKPIDIDLILLSEIMEDIKEKLDLINVNIEKIIKKSNSNKLFFLIKNRDDRLLLLKIVTKGNYDVFIDSFERYKGIYAQIPIDIRKVLAKPFYSNSIKGICYSIEEYMDGKLLERYLFSRLNTFKKKKEALFDCLSWLIEFKKSFKQQLIGKETILNLSGQYEQMYDCSDEELALLKIIEKKISEKNESSIGLYVQHGDLSASNILIKNGNIRIFDWELTGSELVPHQDLFLLLTTGIYSIERSIDDNREKSFMNLFLKKRNRDIFIEFVKRYASKLNITDDMFALYFPIFLMSLPVKQKIRGSSPATISIARNNCKLYVSNFHDIEKFLNM